MATKHRVKARKNYLVSFRMAGVRGRKSVHVKAASSIDACLAVFDLLQVLGHEAGGLAARRGA